MNDFVRLVIVGAEHRTILLVNKPIHFVIQMRRLRRIRRTHRWLSFR